MGDILTVDEEMFCQEWIRNGGNQNGAVKKVWPKLKKPENKAIILMESDRIMARIKAIKAELVEGPEIFTTKQIIEKVQSMIEDPKQYPNIKIQGLTLLAKIRGLLVDRHEISTNPRRIIVRDESGVPMDDFKPEEIEKTDRQKLMEEKP